MKIIKIRHFTLLLLSIILYGCDFSLTHNDYCAQGAEFKKNKQYKEAVELYTQCINKGKHPTYKVLNSRGNAYKYLKDYNKSLGDFNEAIKLNNKYAGSWYNRASLHYKMKNFDLAGADFAKSIELRPTVKGYMGRGNSYYKQGIYEPAINDLKTVIAMQDNHPHAYNTLAWIYATAKDQKYRDGRQAIHLATKAVALSKRQDGSFVDTLAAAYAEAGMFEQALTTQREAVAIFKSQNNIEKLNRIQPALADYHSGKKHY